MESSVEWRNLAADPFKTRAGGLNVTGQTGSSVRTPLAIWPLLRASFRHFAIAVLEAQLLGGSTLIYFHVS